MPDDIELNPREEAFKAILEKDVENKTAEFKESGSDFSTLMGTGEVVSDRPPDIPEDEWAGMSDEAKGDALKIASEETKETDEEKEKAAREAKEVEEAAKVKPKHKIKVDGQEREVDEQEVIDAGIRALQKESAADKRLQEAEDMRREAARLKESLGAPRPSADGGGAPNAGVVDAKALAHAIQYGSEDEAAEALTKLKSKDGLTPEQVAFMVDERAAFREAVGWYKSEFKDIAENPDLHKLFLVKEREARSAGDTRPYRELYEHIGGGMRDWLKALVPPAPKDPLEAKREAKRQQTPQPSSASARQPAPEDTKEPTAAEIVAKMREQRVPN